MRWQFRWEQWRALPVQLRVRKLWQRIVQQRRPPVPRIQQYGEGTGNIVPFVRLPPAVVLEPFRTHFREWWERLRGGYIQLFAPCWLSVPEQEPPVGGVEVSVPEGFRWWDWHKDVFSGYRWAERHPRRPFPLGVDPKVPWELGRLQFLPALVLFAHLEEATAATILEWCRLRVVDFLVQNPPGSGIQWASPLEVAVRAVSLQLFWDFAQKVRLVDVSLERLLFRSFLEHGEFLMRHLEWNGGLRGNHYVGNVVGLLSLGVALQGVPVADTWLAFGIRELISEVLTQFLPDGGHWEGSVYYHRFVLEMALYGTALVLALPPERVQALGRYAVHLWHGERPLAPPPLPEYPLMGSQRTSPFPPEYWERLRAAVHFAAALTKPNGTAPQIGDHDSGRWLKPIPRWVWSSPCQTETYVLPPACSAAAEFHENPRDMMPTLGLAALLCRGCPPEWEQQPEMWLFPRVPILELGTVAPVEVFPDFGVVVYRWGEYMLTVRCGGLAGMHPSGGHMHCDQLSLELTFRDSEILIDPGTYCYGSSAEWRNRFRSTAAHTTLTVHGEEQFRFFGHSSEALFWLFRRGVHARILSRSEREFVGEFEHPHYRHRRTLRLFPEGIEGIDQYWGSAPAALHFHLAPGVSLELRGPQEMLWRSSAGTLRFCSSAAAECLDDWVSPGYGMLQRSRMIRIALGPFGEVRWLLERVG
ncbi:hypothetical protein HRbin21_00682 [bacterium HR21]|nr:hypothetical protein HRbin21_00682 [bacterium HR21]